MSQAASVATIGVIGTGILTLICSVWPADSRRQLIGLLLAALVVRVLCLVALDLYLGGTGRSGFAFLDDQRYHEVGAALARGWEGHDPAGATTSLLAGYKDKGYYLLVGVLYHIFGAESLYARLLNLFVGLYLVIVAVALSRRLWGDKVAWTSGALVAFMPDLVFWSVLQFKDVIVAAMVLTALYGCTAIARPSRGSLKALLWVALPLPLIYAFRLESALVMLAVAVVAVGLRVRRSSHVARGVAVLAVLGAVAGTAWGIARWQGGGRLLVLDMLVEAVAHGEQDPLAFLYGAFGEVARAREQGALSAAFVTSVRDLWRLPMALVAVLLSPFPFWPLGQEGAQDVLAVVSIPWLVMAPIIVVGMVRALQRARVAELPLLGYAVVQWCLLALFLYIFSAPRHRVEFVPVLLSFAAAYMPRAVFAKGLAWSTGAFVLGFLGLLYV